MLLLEATQAAAVSSAVFLVRRGTLLDLDVRKRLFQVVQDYPGLHLREIARMTELDPNHAKYHLQYLEKHGMLSSRKEEGYWRFFPRAEGSVGLRETLVPHEKRILSLLRRPVPLRATLVLLERGEASHSEVEESVGVSRSTLHYHLRKLEEAEVVLSEKAGRERLYRLRDPEALLAMLLQFRPPDALVRGFLEAWEELEVD